MIPLLALISPVGEPQPSAQRLALEPEGGLE